MATYWVATDGNDGNPGTEALPFLTIQFAIDQCIDPPNDEIIVKDGTYTGVGNVDLDFGGVDIHLHSQNGLENCIIDADGSEMAPHRCFIFQTGETADSIVEGFTLTGGVSNEGGAFYSLNATPIIRNCLITGNSTSVAMAPGDGVGGGVYIRGGQLPTFFDCTIMNNTAYGCGGGGVYVGVTEDVLPPIFTNCIISNNIVDPNIGGGYGAGISIIKPTSEANVAITLLVNCLVSNNEHFNEGGRGGGIDMEVVGEEPGYSLNAIIINSAIVENDGGAQGGGLFILGHEYTPIAIITLQNCIVWGNTATNGDQVYISHLTDAIDLFYSCYDNSVGHCAGECASLSFDANTIHDDPLFVDPLTGDFRLQEGSPCIDVAFNDYNDTSEDLDGEPRIFNVIIDMGPFEWREDLGWFYSVRSARPELKHTIITEGQVNRAYNC